MKQKFQSLMFRPSTLEIIRQADVILAEYTEQDLVVTVRQLYYQFVSRDLLPNTQQNYKRLADIISQGRLAGLLDWDAIEDRGRVPDVPSQWDSIGDIVRIAIRQFRLPRWEGQPYHCELWVEKQALAGVLIPIAREFHVTLMVNKGYSSQSAMRESAKRFLDHPGQIPLLLYLGDHDPSGEDMVRDIRDRLVMFGVEAITVEKVALTMGQIRRYRPPPNPAKSTDPRYDKYQKAHGDESWELDALDPPTLRKLVRGRLAGIIDRKMMQAVIAREDEGKKRLGRAVGGLGDGSADEGVAP